MEPPSLKKIVNHYTATNLGTRSLVSLGRRKYFASIVSMAETAQEKPRWSWRYRSLASSRCSVSQGATRKTARNSAFSFFSRAVFRAEPLTERLEEAKTRLSVLARITSSPRLSSIVRLTLRIRNSGTILWSCMLTARNFIFRKIFFGTQSCFHQVTVHIKEKEELSWSINDDLKISRFKSADTIYHRND